MRVSLALDNCFAMKRWTRPAEWMAIAREMGIHCIEASADNEIDPLYSVPDALAAWGDEVRRESARSGVRVVNLYSGHGTYCTLGLGHHSHAVRAHLRRDWVMPMLKLASELGAGLGCYVHAFDAAMLSSPTAFAASYQNLMIELHALADYADTLGMGYFGIEQMYSPHQIPWTICGARQFIQDASAGTRRRPVYTTLDTGHQSGQHRFQRPTEPQLRAFHVAARSGGDRPALHLGTREHYLGWWVSASKCTSADEFVQQFREFEATHAHLFAEPEDGDTYAWIEAVGAYSPILHLQQTDGTVSAHKSFTAANNAWGRISPPEVLKALARSARQSRLPGVAPVEHIYLTLEMFLGTACDPRAAVDEIAESAAYWRKYVPKDNSELESLVAGLE